MGYCQQFHRFTQRYDIQHINCRDVLHNHRAQLHQINSNSWYHCTKRAIWRCEYFQTWESLNVVKPTVHPQYRNMGTSLISLIDDLSESPSESGHIFHFLFRYLWWKYGTPGSVISYFVNSSVDNFTSRASTRSTSSMSKYSFIISSSTSLSSSPPIFPSDTSVADSISLATGTCGP